MVGGEAQARVGGLKAFPWGVGRMRGGQDEGWAGWGVGRMRGGQATTGQHSCREETLHWRLLGAKLHAGLLMKFTKNLLYRKCCCTFWKGGWGTGWLPGELQGSPLWNVLLNLMENGINTLRTHWISFLGVSAELTTEKPVGVPLDLIEKLPV